MDLSSTGNMLPEDVSPAHLMYGMMSAFALAFIPVLLALVINFSQHGSGVVMRSHIKWQRWSMLVFLSLSILAWLLPQGWMGLGVFGVAVVWFVHRIIKGWMALADGICMA